jgi:hypothetical protein
VARAVANTRRLPGASVPPQPDQAVLDALQAELATAV